MTTIVTRAGKGSPLTNNELDANFTNLNTAKVEVTGTPLDGQVITWDSATSTWVPDFSAGSGTVTSVDVSGGSTGLTFSGGPITSSGTITMAGTLGVTYGGTGGTTASTARANLSAAVLGANNDITSLTGITGGITAPDFVQFDTTATATPAVGQLNWNGTDGTLDLGLKGGNVVLQVGQEEVVRVTNDTLSTMTSGQAVYITGSTGNHLNVKLAQANSEITSSKTLAIITESISANQSGFATTSGLVRDFDTSALTEGAAVWLSPTVAGGLTSTKPSAPDHLVLIGWCVKQHATVGVLYVHIANGYEVDELHDVKITGTPAAGSLLIRNATDKLWENATITPGTGISVINADKSITITNSAPDQTVSLTGAGTTSVTGTYPNFTITSNDTYTGTVTSVDISGGTTGLTFSGGPVTTSGTITASGTLGVANGGTGQTTFTNGQLLIGNTTGNTLTKATLTQGTGITVTNGNGSITITNSAPDQTVTLSNGTGISVSGTYPSFTITNSSPMTYPGAGIPISTGTAWNTSKTAPSGVIVGDTDTQTLTNKRVNPRVSSTASITSPLAINSDNFDQYAATAQAGNFTISADAGTPVDGQKLIFRIDDNGTPRTITFTGGVSKGFQPVGVTLTASGSDWTYTTTASKVVYFGCVYNTAVSRWEIIALSLQA